VNNFFLRGCEQFFHNDRAYELNSYYYRITLNFNGLCPLFLQKKTLSILIIYILLSDQELRLTPLLVWQYGSHSI